MIFFPYRQTPNTTRRNAPPSAVTEATNKAIPIESNPLPNRSIARIRASSTRRGAKFLKRLLLTHVRNSIRLSPTRNPAADAAAGGGGGGTRRRDGANPSPRRARRNPSQRLPTRAPSCLEKGTEEGGGGLTDAASPSPAAAARSKRRHGRRVRGGRGRSNATSGAGGRNGLGRGDVQVIAGSARSPVWVGGFRFRPRRRPRGEGGFWRETRAAAPQNPKFSPFPRAPRCCCLAWPPAKAQPLLLPSKPCLREDGWFMGTN